MNKKQNWAWAFLFWLYLFTVLSNTVVFFNPQSPTTIYHQILIGFDLIFLIPYLLNLLAIIFDILAIMPFYNFLYPRKNLIGTKHISLTAWRWFFAIRFILIFIGHTYEMKQTQAILNNDIFVALSILVIMLLLYGPSYYANFVLAYQNKHWPK